MKVMPSIYDFQSIRPRYEFPQTALLTWLAKAHAQSEKQRCSTILKESFHEEILAKLKSLGLGTGKIDKRGFSVSDPLHDQWSNMEIYNLSKYPSGSPMSQRMDVYEHVTNEMLEKFYEGQALPEHLIQISCTGYVSPSAIQSLVSKRKAKSYITHAFHMGCYGALAALRIAVGYCSKSVDLIHTELCGLHLNPMQHEIGQLVAQTLFADGFIKYRCGKENRGLNVLAIHEEIIPQSLSAMNWRIGDFGMQIFLGKTIPIQIRRHLPQFINNLFQSAGILELNIDDYYLALHPGGPKIIEGIASLFNVKEEKLRHTKAVLKNFGNMSSATLPHIWQEMFNDQSVAVGSKIISLAFGPGLTIFGAVMEKGEKF